MRNENFPNETPQDGVEWNERQEAITNTRGLSDEEWEDRARCITQSIDLLDNAGLRSFASSMTPEEISELPSKEYYYLNLLIPPATNVTRKVEASGENAPRYPYVGTSVGLRLWRNRRDRGESKQEPLHGYRGAISS